MALSASCDSGSGWLSASFSAWNGSGAARVGFFFLSAFFRLANPGLGFREREECRAQGILGAAQARHGRYLVKVYIGL